MRFVKRWKKTGAVLLALTLLTGSIQGRMIQAEERAVMTGQTELPGKEKMTEQKEEVPEETEQLLTEMETGKQTEFTEEIQQDESDREKMTEETENAGEGEENTESEQQSEEKTEAASEPEKGSTLERDSEEETESEKETESESESETEDLYGIVAFAMNRTPSGSPIAQAGGWQAVTSANRFSPDYLPVKFYPGISSLEVFNSSSQVVVGTTSSGRTYLYPKTAGQGGMFGAIYRKVLYSNHRWYDLRMTVTNYTSKIHYDGGGTMESYPFILMLPSVIEWRFIQSIGGVVMKCEFLDSATGAVSPVNTRFQWWDVDSAQRFGMKTGDGVIAGKYYYSGSKVYVESGATVAGVKNLEMLVGPTEDSETTDPNYCVTYELQNCSTYYMAIGPRDHIDDDNYSYGKSHIQELNDKLKNATATDIDSSQTLLQTDTSLTIIDTPAPEKTVSGDGNIWGTENDLASVSDSYWYQIRQFVPWQSSKAYYQSLTIQDQLPQGLEYVGNAHVIREEDGKDMTGNFVIEPTGGVVRAAAGASLLGSKNLYGYHFLLRFQVRMVPTDQVPQYSGNTALYEVKNTAMTVYQHKTDGTVVEKRSNEVLTRASVCREEQPSPEKYLDRTPGKTEKNLILREDEILFCVRQKLPENKVAFLPQAVTITDSLASCLELVEVQTGRQRKGADGFTAVPNAQIENQDNQLTVRIPLEAEDNGGILQIEMRCRIRKGMDLSPWKKTTSDGSMWVQIPNKADVTVEWKNGAPSSITKSSNQAQANLRINHIWLTKQIQTEDIVWAHGNPIFIFSITGKDAAGKPQAWHQAVEFTQEQVSAEGKAILTADFEVPAGIYEASEEKTMRYQLEEISQIQNGTKLGERVKFDLTYGGDGKAVFQNQKTTDAEESHTALVNNKIG